MSIIYKKVQTLEDYDTFYNTIIPSWLESNYELECVLGDVSRYIVLNEVPVGTIEIIPYNLKDSYINQFFPFDELLEVKLNAPFIAEIDGISTHPDHRKPSNLERIAYTLCEHYRKNGLKYGVGLINPRLYRVLKRVYEIPIEQVGNKIGKQYKAIPCLLNAEKIYKNLRDYPWLYNLYQMDFNLARKIVYS